MEGEDNMLQFYPAVFGHIEVRADPRRPGKLRRPRLTGVAR
jgi:hypothetical protein